MPERWAWGVAAALWAGLIFWMSSQSPGAGRLPIPDVPGLDKVAHAFAFGVLAALFAQALRGTGEIRSLVLAAAIASAFGVSDELHQRLTPGRDPSVLDWVADTVGALLAVAGVWFLRR